MKKTNNSIQNSKPKFFLWQIPLKKHLPITTILLFGAFSLLTSNSYQAQCIESITPDLPLLPTTPAIEAEMDTVIQRYSDKYLPTPPSATNLNSANASYAALNITVSGNTISGNTINNFSDVSFLRTYARHLKYNPNDAVIQQNASRVVWLVCSQYCDGTLSHDGNMYEFRHFIRPAVFIAPYLNATSMELFKYIVYKHAADFTRFYEPNYDAVWQAANGAINTDEIYNISDALIGYALVYSDLQERYRYLRTYKRYLERFMSYSSGTSNGLKPDGTGFHHNSAYNNYMYAYRTAAKDLSYLKNTIFQVEEENYKRFRNAVYCLFIQSNDARLYSLSACGRKPHQRYIGINDSYLEVLATAGGVYTNTPEDELMAGLYNRVFGVNPNFSYSGIASFDEGFYDFNHANTGVWRKDNTVIISKGFSNALFGAELYWNSNRYGRYQSYGATEIIYPGDITDNGFDENTWDWNFHPGTTVIRLPWTELHGEYARIDEIQQKGFAGAISFHKTTSELLSNNRGQNGLFAMDFKERDDIGWSTVYSPTIFHNSTFEFKKSNFFFDDIIVSLGSDIANDDNVNPTITTLFQRMDNNGLVNVNGADITNNGEFDYGPGSNRWVLSNYNTGFYLVSNDDELVIKREPQSTPNHDDYTPSSYSTPTEDYCIGYIDHGTNPSNKSYEYILIPNSSVTEMQSLETQITSAGKPYTVHQQNSQAHIVEHLASETWGYALFSPASNLSFGDLKSTDIPCLIMNKPINNGSQMMLSVGNPDLGIEFRSNDSVEDVVAHVTLHQEWQLVGSYANASIISSSQTETVLEITLKKGLSEDLILEEVDSSIGVESYTLNNFELFPNPTNGEFNIELNKNEPFEVEVMDINGKIIYQSTATSKSTINLKGQKSGIYFVQVTTNDSQMVEKLVYQNN